MRVKVSHNTNHTLNSSFLYSITFHFSMSVAVVFKWRHSVVQTFRVANLRV